jgi:ribosomal protein L29
MKFKIIKDMDKKEREKRLKELKVELSRVQVKGKEAGGKAKQIRKIIARIMTLNTQEAKVSKEELKK